MTTVDAAVLAFLLILGLFGWLSGAIRQLTHWAGLLLAYFFARPLAAKLTPTVTPHLAALLPPKFPLSPTVVNMGLSSSLFSLIFIVATVVLSALAANAFADHEDGKANRIGGFALGAAKGAALVFAAISVLLFLEKPLKDAFGAFPEPLAKSAAVVFVRAHNPLETAPIPALARIEKLMAAMKDPQAAEALLRDPELRKLLDDPSLSPALKDKNLERALRSGDWSALKNDPRIAELLKDPRIAGKLPQAGAEARWRYLQPDNIR